MSTWKSILKKLEKNLWEFILRTRILTTKNESEENIMLNDTHVTTSYANGTIISMDAVSTKIFLENIAITTIAQCREMTSKERMGVLESTTKLPYYDELIEEYCAGVHGAVLSNMLCQNVQILYRFVQDCVLNDTSRGLYLLYEKPRNGEPVWKLLLLALDEYMDLVKREYEILGKKIPYDLPKYNEYNKQFEELMAR